jgi:hypothetical protein
MAKVWVLDTSTKGTGATVVPLDGTPEKPKRDGDAPLNVAKAPPRKRAEPEPAPRRPRRFKVVDLQSSETLAEGADMRATLDVLSEVRSPVDVRIFVWDDDTDGWLLLKLREQRALWEAAAGGADG